MQIIDNYTILEETDLLYCIELDIFDMDIDVFNPAMLN